MLGREVTALLLSKKGKYISAKRMEVDAVTPKTDKTEIL